MLQKIKSSKIPLVFGMTVFIIITLLQACRPESETSFYYSGDEQIEIIISGDTLGILLKDTLLVPGDTAVNYIGKVRKLADSSLSAQGYEAAGYLADKSFTSDKIKLVTSSPSANTRKALETRAKSIKTQENKTFVYNTGYLARIKTSQKPLIITDEIIIKFRPGTATTAINSIYNEYNLVVIKANPFDTLQFTVATTNNSQLDALKISQELKLNSHIQYAQPNFIFIKKTTGEEPGDRYYLNQWALHNTDENPVEDADIDADLAWNFTKGNNTLIAVIDVGFDVMHEDLANNFARNIPDIPWNNIDDDGNLFVDDTLGWNFITNSNNLNGGPHGTAIAGIIAAETDTIGISGVCPECKIIPIRTDHSLDTYTDALSFRYAVSRGARVINCSWEYDGMNVPDNVVDAVNFATGSGVVVVCSATNSNANYCSGIKDLTSLVNTIAVSRSTNKDMYDLAGCGDCIDLLAPTATDDPSRGLLKIYTTDITGPPGFNDGSVDFHNCGNVINENYTGCFLGTSTSAAITSGVVGLVLAANPTLTPQQVQYLLQDCADKIEDSNAEYLEKDGKSFKKTHGYGRVNAFEAVKIASSEMGKGGRNGVDIFFQDNDLDWGNTEKPSSFSFEPTRGTQGWWKSMDIKVDALADQGGAAVLDNNGFENLRNENPIGGQNNKVYVRVRNRGFRTASSVSVKLYWVHAGAALPSLPAGFWDNFPTDISDPNWNSLGSKTISDLRYCGPSVANAIDYGAQIVSFDFLAPVHDASTRNHYCLMAIITSPDDEIPAGELATLPDGLVPDYVTTHYNNATHRNYNIVEMDLSFSSELYLHNPFPDSIYSKITLSYKGEKNPLLIEDSLLNKAFLLKKNEKKKIKFKINNTDIKSNVEISIQQLVLTGKKDEYKVIGGINYLLVPPIPKSKKTN